MESPLLIFGHESFASQLEIISIQHVVVHLAKITWSLEMYVHVIPSSTQLLLMKLEQ